MSRSELERSKQRWFLIAGRPIKTAGSLLDKAKPALIETFGGMKITRDMSVKILKHLVVPRQRRCSVGYLDELLWQINT